MISEAVFDGIILFGAQDQLLRRGIIWHTADITAEDSIQADTIQVVFMAAVSEEAASIRAAVFIPAVITLITEVLTALTAEM